jgi:DNA-binding NtrC family response regulator
MKEKFDGLVDRLIEGNVSLDEAIEILERSMIRQALLRSGGNQCAGAKLLGIHRNTLQRKIEKYELGRKPPARATRLRKRRTPAA